MSHNTQQTSQTSHQGKIHADNPELLKLITDNKLNSHPNKVTPRKLGSSKEKLRKVEGSELLKSGGDETLEKKVNKASNQNNSANFVEVSDGGDTNIKSVRNNKKENYNRKQAPAQVNKKDKQENNTEKTSKPESFENNNTEGYKDKNLRNKNLNSLSEKKQIVKADEEPDQYFLSDINESDRETLGSASSELALLRSPSRGSLNAGFESSPVATSPVRYPDGDSSDTDTVVDEPVAHPSPPVTNPYSNPQKSESPITNPYSNPQKSESPITNPYSNPQNSDSPKSKVGNSGQNSDKDFYEVYQQGSSQDSPVKPPSPPSPTAGDANLLKNKTNPIHSQFPKGTSPRTSAPAVKLTPTTNLSTSLTHALLHHPDPLPQQSSSYPYSSYRLKSIGTAAKRADESVDFQTDSLEFERDSLEIKPETDLNEGNNREKGVEESRTDWNLPENILDDSKTPADSLEEHGDSDSKVKVNEADVTSNQRNNFIGFSPHSRGNHHSPEFPLQGENSDHLSDLSVSKQENYLFGPAFDQALPVFQNQNSNSHLYQPTSGLSAKSALVNPSSPSNPPRLTEQPAQKAVFVLKTGSSRQSSVLGTGRSSESQPPVPENPSATASMPGVPIRKASSSHRVYETSPTFSEEEFRLVNSRLEGVEGEKLDTYRELDMAAIKRQENHALIGGPKNVTYGGVGRYESREDTVGYGRSEDNEWGPSNNIPSNPYGLKMAEVEDRRDSLRMPGSPPSLNTYGGDSPIHQQPSTHNTAHQGRIIINNPHHLQDSGPQRNPSTLNHPQQPVPSQNQLQPPQGVTRVRGISLPTGPSYDPADEEDLLREKSYQHGLRMRIDDGIKKVEKVEVPKLPLHQGQYDSQDYVQDSLDYGSVDETARAFVEAFQPEPMDTTDRHQPQEQFRNPPPLPKDLSGYRQQFNNGHLSNVNFDSEDYTEYEDVRNHHLNPKVQQRFYNPQYDNQPGASTVNSGRYVEMEDSTSRSDMSSLPPQKQPVRSKPPQPPMEAVHPTPPKYDYVNNNKEDLGKPPPKSYKHIHEVTKEEKEKLNEIFIHPKPKPKAGILKKKGQDSHRGPQPNEVEQYDDENDEKLSTAEQVWAQRSATLAKKFDGKNRGRGRGRGGSIKLQKYGSDFSLYQPRSSSQQTLPPDRRAFLTEMPTPPSNQSPFHTQVSVPVSPRHTDIQILPVSSHVVLEDGQRISVDVNLKLISPTHQYQPHGYQEPAPHGYPPHYGGGQGRQYPAVTHYDEDISGNNVRALEYHHPDYNAEDLKYVSPRERYSADEALRMMSESRTDINPYGKIPPIVKSSEGVHPSSAPLPDQAGSYIDMYRKQKEKDNEKPWYKVYGLKDYRKMQKEVRLGTLGPDLESDALKERREKFQRQNEYAKQVMEKNRSEFSHKKPPAFPRPKEDNDILNRRKLAVEYAKSVPKPTVKPQPSEYNNYELASERSPIAKHHRRVDENMTPGLKNTTPSPRQPTKQKEMDVLDIEKLRQRYEEDKQNEALIRRNTTASLPKGEKYY